MPYAAHRQGDQRICGATTIVQGQSDVYVNNKLWSVEGDPNTHGNGQLIATGQTVLVNNKKVICNTPDHANPDNQCPLGGQQHCDPMTAQGSDDTFAY